jgi:hypothetical protein
MSQKYLSSVIILALKDIAKSMSLKKKAKAKTE